MSTHTPPHAGVRQQRDHVRTRPVLAAIFGAVVLGGLGVLWAGLQLRGKDQLYRPAGVRAPRGEVVTGSASVGGISQTLIGVDSSAVKRKRQELEMLHTFEWIDRAQGIARIPIDTAMNLIIQRSRQ